MIVELGADGAVVREPDDCISLSVATALTGTDLDAALHTSGTGTRSADGDSVLLDVSVLHDRARAGASAPDWESRWTAMIEYAARKGWLSADGSAVQAHVERAS